MRTMRLLPFCLLILSLAACGGRSGPRTFGISSRDGSTPDEAGHASPDGAPRPERAKLDSRVFKKDARPRDLRARDTRPRDLKPKPDSCLPVAAATVIGNYSGTWKGSWTCPGIINGTVNGSLTIAMALGSSPTSYPATGKLTGTVNPGFSVTGTLSGGLSCASFVATWPDLTLGAGTFTVKLAGKMNGTYAKMSNGKWGFPSGSWSAQSTTGGCTASGTWTAKHN